MGKWALGRVSGSEIQSVASLKFMASALQRFRGLGFGFRGLGVQGFRV